MKRISNWYRNQGIVTKLYAVLFGVVILPLVAFIIINNHITQDAVTRQSSAFYGNILDQTEGYITDKTRTVKSVLDMISGDANIQDQTADFFSPQKSSLGNWLVYNYDSQLLFNGYLNQYISRISLYLNRNPLRFESSPLHSMMDEGCRADYQAWRENTDAYYLWLTSPSLHRGQMQAKYITYLCKIPSANKLGAVLGLMQADIPLAALEAILDEAAVSPNAALFLINNRGEVFARGGAGAYALESGAARALDALPRGQAEPLQSLVWGAGRYLGGQRDIAFSDWRLVYLVPEKDYLQVTSAWRNAMLINIAIIVLCAMPLLYLAARSVTGRLRRLSDSLERAADVNFDIELPAGDHDEIGRLIDRFNYMAVRTNELLDERYRMGQQLKAAELHVLQEQINPHFLYNTLDMLHWMALRSGETRMNEVLSSLSSFYRLSLSKGEDLVPLEREIRHVEAYMHIQNVRFSDRIHLVIDVPEALHACPVPRILLQPLVENAIQHGIREREDESGTIEITARALQDGILLTIRDDGVGMDAKTLDRLNDPYAKPIGYGVRNTGDRLALHFGPMASLCFESADGCGVTVSIRIPWNH